jgi:hypothetical protein
VSEGQGAQAGWRQAILVLGVVIDVVLVGASITFLVPPLRDAVLHTPVTIAVLIVGTVLVLWRLAVKAPPT